MQHANAILLCDRTAISDHTIEKSPGDEEEEDMGEGDIGGVPSGEPLRGGPAAYEEGDCPLPEAEEEEEDAGLLVGEALEEPVTCTRRQAWQ